jgi:hypothetical protein
MIQLKKIEYKGVTLSIPEIWTAETESYTEPDGRECAMIDISANGGDPRSIIISYGPMPEGSDVFMEAEGTYDELMGDAAAETEESPICEYDFLGKTACGFEFPTEDGLACNFICVAVGQGEGQECNLLTILTTGRTYEEIDDLLDLIEEKLTLE